MPRYHFSIYDGKDCPDPEGTHLPDLAAARQEALRLAGQCVSDLPDLFWEEGDWRLVVTNDSGLHLLSIMLVAYDFATPVRPTKN